MPGPDGPRYAVRARVDDALLDRRQPRSRGPLRAARRRPVRLGGRRRVLVQARVVRVRLAVVSGTAALVPRPMVLVVHVDRIYPETTCVLYHNRLILLETSISHADDHQSTFVSECVNVKQSTL